MRERGLSSEENVRVIPLSDTKKVESKYLVISLQIVTPKGIYLNWNCELAHLRGPCKSGVSLMHPYHSVHFGGSGRLNQSHVNNQFLNKAKKYGLIYHYP